MGKLKANLESIQFKIDWIPWVWKVPLIRFQMIFFVEKCDFVLIALVLSFAENVKYIDHLTIEH